MKKFLPLAAVIFAVSGCLPAGDPPTGAITTNTEKIPCTPEEKRERMIAELTVLIFQYAPGAGMRFTADNASAAEMDNIIRECAKITGIHPDRNAPWLLHSYFTADKWIIELVNNGKVIDRVMVAR